MKKRISKIGTIRKILTLISVLLFYFMAKEFLTLFFLLSNVSPILAWAMVAGSIGFVVYFGVMPIVEILRMPSFEGPTTNKNKVKELRKRRIEAFKKNPYLINNVYDLEYISNSQEDYERIVNIISDEAKEVRKRFVNGIFYKTGVSQNGFIDGLIILGSSTAMIKEIFVLYNGRAEKRGLINIFRKVLFAISIGGSDGVEIAADEIFNKLAFDGLKKIPFGNIIFSSIADGFTNAVMLTKIAIITENYCKELYVENEKSLFPTSKEVFDTSKNITGSTLKLIKDNVKKMAEEGFSDNIAKRTFNNVGNYFTNSKEKMVSAIGNAYSKSKG